MLAEGARLFEKWRPTVGLFAGPAILATLLLFPISGLDPPAARLAAVIAWVVIWWITEPVPLPLTAVLGPAVAVVCGVQSAKAMFAAFGNPIIFLFLGSFLIAEAMTTHGLDRRIALALLGSRFVGASASRILTGFALLGAALSMWLSNTATTAMLYPIALGVLVALTQIADQADSASTGRASYSVGLLLACAYGSSIGGVGTPVGTPPNLIVIGQLEKLAGVRVSFFDWMLVAAPAAAVMIVLTAIYLNRRFPAPMSDDRRTAEYIVRERAKLGTLTRAQINVIVAFMTAVALWVLPGLLDVALGRDSPVSRWCSTALHESVVAVLAAGLLFVLPVDWTRRRFTLTWTDAVRIDWGTLLLFGGGLALGGAMFETGLADAIGRALISATGARSTLALTLLFTVFSIYFTEITSNTAAATMLAPLAIAAACSAGADPVAPAIGCALGCSMAFMLPVATPPNAIVYGSGRVGIADMIRTGFWLNLIAAIVIPLCVFTLRSLLTP
jgi:sodium-dependent dicarboxylate transporter 2/3/5